MGICHIRRHASVVSALDLLFREVLKKISHITKL